MAEDPEDPVVADPVAPGVDLYWIPLGADTHVVRWSGRIFEAVGAWWHRRAHCDLFHAALIVRVAEGRYVAWTLVRGGVEIDAVAVPAGGRAPGWQAGIDVARRA